MGVVPKNEMTIRGLAPDLTSPSGESLVRGGELAGLLQLHLGVTALNNPFSSLGAEDVAPAGGAYVAFP